MKDVKWSVVIDDVPTKFITGVKKTKTHYVSYNAIFSTPHHTIRTKIVNKMKDFINLYLLKMPFYSVPVSITLVYHSKRTTFDLDNKCGIWCKVILDLMKVKNLKDDNVKYVKEINYQFVDSVSEKDKMEIIISPLKMKG